MSKVRFGVVGFGVIGKIHAEIIADMPEATLAGIADVSLSVSKEIKEKFGCSYYENYKDMLKRDNIDAVVVCLPSGMHYQVTLDAAKAGKHVIVEKPIDIDVDRTNEMIETCRKYGVKLSVIMQHRFDDAIIALKKTADNHELGNLHLGTSKTIWYREPEYYSKNPWRGTWKLDGGGALINQSIHYIDLLLYIMGPVESVSGRCKTLFHKSIETEDTGIATLQFKSGAVGTIEGTTIAFPGLHTELSIYGENGTVIIKDDKLDFYKFKDGKRSVFEELMSRNSKKVKENEFDTGSHKKQYEDIIDAIKQGRQPLVTGEEASIALKVIKAIYKSSELHKEVTV